MTQLAPRLRGARALTEEGQRMTHSERLRAAKARAVRAILARILARVLVFFAILAIGHCIGACAARHLLESPWNR